MKQITLTLLAIFYFNCVFSQSNNLYNLTNGYGIFWPATGSQTSIVTSNQNIVTAKQIPITSTINAINITRFDNNNNVIYDKFITTSISSKVFGLSVLETSAKNLIISYYNSNFEMCVLSLDVNLNIMWSKVFKQNNVTTGPINNINQYNMYSKIIQSRKNYLGKEYFFVLYSGRPIPTNSTVHRACPVVTEFNEDFSYFHTTTFDHPSWNTSNNPLGCCKSFYPSDIEKGENEFMIVGYENIDNDMAADSKTYYFKIKHFDPSLNDFRIVASSNIHLIDNRYTPDPLSNSQGNNMWIDLFYDRENRYFISAATHEVTGFFELYNPSLGVATGIDIIKIDENMNFLQRRNFWNPRAYENYPSNIFKSGNDYVIGTMTDDQIQPYESNYHTYSSLLKVDQALNPIFFKRHNIEHFGNWEYSWNYSTLLKNNGVSDEYVLLNNTDTDPGISSSYDLQVVITDDNGNSCFEHEDELLYADFPIVTYRPYELIEESPIEVDDYQVSIYDEQSYQETCDQISPRNILSSENNDTYVYPNFLKSTNSITIKTSNKYKKVDVQIIDINGKIIKKIENLEDNSKIDLKSIPIINSVVFFKISNSLNKMLIKVDKVVIY